MKKKPLHYFRQLIEIFRLDRCSDKNLTFRKDSNLSHKQLAPPRNRSRLKKGFFRSGGGVRSKRRAITGKKGRVV